MNHRLYIQIVAGVAALVYTILLWKSGITPEVRWLRGYSIVVLSVVVLWGAWDRWIWRVSLFQRMQFVPPRILGHGRANFVPTGLTPTPRLDLRKSTFT